MTDKRPKYLEVTLLRRLPMTSYLIADAKVRIRTGKARVEDTKRTPIITDKRPKLMEATLLKAIAYDFLSNI